MGRRSPPLFLPPPVASPFSQVGTSGLPIDCGANLDECHGQDCRHDECQFHCEDAIGGGCNLGFPVKISGSGKSPRALAENTIHFSCIGTSKEGFPNMGTFKGPVGGQKVGGKLLGPSTRIQRAQEKCKTVCGGCLNNPGPKMVKEKTALALKFKCMGRYSRCRLLAARARPPQLTSFILNSVQCT